MSDADKKLISFTEDTTVDREISLVDLNGSDLEAYSVIFSKPVLIQRCSFRSFTVQGGGFFQGLTVGECHFNESFYFFAGGHNMNGAGIQFRNCIFHSFADFGDCWFEGPFEVTECNFRKGTNLLGNIGTPIEVRYDVAPSFSGVHGKLDIDTFSH